MKHAVAVMLCAVGLAAAQRGPPPMPSLPGDGEPAMQAAVSEKTDCGYCSFWSSAWEVCVPVPGRFKCFGTVGITSGKACGSCSYAEQDGDADHCVDIPADVCGSAEFKPPSPPSPAPSAAAPALAVPAPTAGLPRTAGGEVLGSTRPGDATTVPDSAEVAAMQAAEEDAPAAPVPLPVRPKGPHPPPRH